MKRRQFNMPLAKAAVMFLLSGVLGLMSGASGISNQIAADPLIGFMLGFTPERRAGTALMAAVAAAVAAVGGAMLTGQASVSVELVALLTASAFIGVVIGGVKLREVAPGWSDAALDQVLNHWDGPGLALEVDRGGEVWELELE